MPIAVRPSTAERIRSVCVRATAAMLAVDGFAPVDTQIHHLLDDGAVAVARTQTLRMRSAVDGRTAMGMGRLS